jgi:hypothetical protein
MVKLVAESVSTSINSLLLKARKTESGASYFTMEDFENNFVSSLME